MNPPTRSSRSESRHSAQSRTLRAVSGNWNGGIPVLFRLQADKLEGQVKSGGIDVNGGSVCNEL